MRTLSIVIPAYNEEPFIGTLLERIRDVDLRGMGVGSEIIVVDDCSTDRTADIVGGFAEVTLVRQPVNGGKGRAVRTGIARSTGDYLLIQDADLEYDPRDYPAMLELVLSGRADVVYGSRYLRRPDRGPLANLAGGKHADQSWTAYLGGQSLSVVTWALTGHYLTDTVTAYKLYPRPWLASLDLKTSGFETDHEITCKALARGLRIVEVPIRYYPRTRAEGKKIGLRDWVIATRTLWRYRRG